MTINKEIIYIPNNYSLLVPETLLPQIVNDGRRKELEKNLIDDSRLFELDIIHPNNSRQANKLLLFALQKGYSIAMPNQENNGVVTLHLTPNQTVLDEFSVQIDKLDMASITLLDWLDQKISPGMYKISSFDIDFITCILDSQFALQVSVAH